MTTERALVTKIEVEDIVHRLYGLRVLNQSYLNSYDDINIHVHVDKQCSNAHISSVSDDGYVLKILNSLDSQKVDFIGAMHGAIEVVCNAGIPTSFPISNIHGEFYSLEKLKCQSGEKECMFLVRLFQFIPGDLLDGKTYTHQLCFQVGQLAGKLDKALQGFNHPGLINHSRHWNLREVGSLGDKIDCITDENDNHLVKEVVQKFKTDVLKNSDLSRGVIHADLNEGNIIVKAVEVSSSEGEEQQNTYNVHGVLDFGDLVDELRVYEIAIAVAYMMIECKDLDKIDVGGHTLAGYLSEMNLSAADGQVLKVCICARMAQSYTYGAYEHMKDPSNTYCLNTSKKGWPILRQLWRMSDEELFKRWNHIFQQYNINQI